MEPAIKHPDAGRGHIIDGPTEDVDQGVEGGESGADRRGRNGGYGDESVLLRSGGVWVGARVEGEPEVGRGGGVAEGEVEGGLSAAEEAARGEEERGREEGVEGLGDERESGMVGTGDSGYDVHGDVVREGGDQWVGGGRSGGGSGGHDREMGGWVWKRK